MNGVISNKESSIIDRKPIITCAGELEVFSSLEDSLSFALPQESCEWRRSLGRPVRNVHIGVKFTPFSPEALPRENQWDLIRHPLFHIYWTECLDVDVYKTNVRDDIEGWLKELNARNITDWLIVVVETFDLKRANKLLPRTTVLDKIRADFAPKQGDRCISVLNPSRQENRTADSWRGLVARVRYLVLVAYARAVSRLEEHVRAQREKRNEPGWHFIKYFRLQEELAQVLEMLGLHDESLVQYDELDALFSQFVVNAHAGDVASWLSEFQKPLDRWHGLKLPEGSDDIQILSEMPSLLELRAYLYSRQARMLLLTGKPWEMAERCLPFLHTCVRELSLLEVQSPPGSVNCWLFLAAMEVLHACERYNRSSQTNQVEAYSLHTAALWEYASRKLRQLGELCGLITTTTTTTNTNQMNETKNCPTSEQLHIVVSLSAGMGDNPGSPKKPSPTDKLKEALCSQEAFNRHYLELSELAMGTYKHVGRLRSARLVGRELASFYKTLGETQKAAIFLGDALKTFEQENWHELAAQTQLELASCHLQANDIRRYIKSCAAVAAAPEMDTLIRNSHFDEMIKSISKIDKPLYVPFVNVFKIQCVNIKSDLVLMQDSYLNVDLELDCNFPRKIVCSNIRISLESERAVKKSADDLGSVLVNKSLCWKDIKQPDVYLQKLKIFKHLEYRQDKQLASASVVCKNTPLKRMDSTAKPKLVVDWSNSLQSVTTPIALTPGLNTVPLRWLASVSPGLYTLGHVCVELGQLQFVSLPLASKLKVEVHKEEPHIRLDKTTTELLAGIPQTMLLTITIGSYPVQSDSKIKLKCSRGLTMQVEQKSGLVQELEINVHDGTPLSCTRYRLQVFCDLPAREHHVQVKCPWNDEMINVPLDFTSPLSATMRLHTARKRKFVQIVVCGQSSTKIKLNKPTLRSESSGVVFQDLNPLIENQNSVISSGNTMSFMWELKSKPKDNKPMKNEFSIEYAVVDEEKNEVKEAIWRNYTHNFNIVDYQTLYIVEARVEPSKGSEFCRVGALCHLRLSIKPVIETNDDDDDDNVEQELDIGTGSLMYEVLAEQSVWAVCGRTAGVVSVGPQGSPQSVTLDVMPLTSGYLPLPLVRLSKYIPADKQSTSDTHRKTDSNAHPRLEPFSPGQVYNSSKGQQIHVLTVTNDQHLS